MIVVTVALLVSGVGVGFGGVAAGGVTVRFIARAAGAGGTALVAFVFGDKVELDAAVLFDAGADGAFDDGGGEALA
jgi:hypothetical protein